MKRPRPIKRPVRRLTAVDLAAIGRIVEASVARGLSGRFAGLKATLTRRRGGC